MLVFAIRQQESAIGVHMSPSLLNLPPSVAKSCPALCNPMDCSRQAPLSVGFPRQEYWGGLPFPFPGSIYPIHSKMSSFTEFKVKDLKKALVN